ncbi:MAG TPA: PIN domain nuclease [Pseudonocardiaceae bacterium]|nr:PIN domain nuclease [Pseudonocardiaceae bacterium]
MAVVARYLLDTSVWARRRHPGVAAHVVPLIGAGLVATCSVLDTESLYSTRTAAEYEQVRRDRRAAYEFLVTDQEVWDRALDVQRELALRSMTRSVGIPDLLVGAVAELHRVTVLHYDADFDHISGITGQPTEWVVPRGAVP